ncbi:AfsR/SARP family transcriptional regulator [Streptomyces sp. NPDC095817]|uniref:AfsR/SARP family transcriptional regulator n=1 Tax=Streptomyces sp. NPDC095817 TaxID=3155082 RepID=UPI003330CEA2
MNTSVRFTSLGYQLVVDPQNIDSYVFEKNISASRSLRKGEDTEGVCKRLEESLNMWRGAAYSGLTQNPTLSSESERLELLRINTVEALADRYLSLRRPDLTASHLAVEVRKYPLREHLIGRFMKALYHLGRQAEAFDVYEQTRIQLRSDFGVQPSESLREIHQAILKQDLNFPSP